MAVARANGLLNLDILALSLLCCLLASVVGFLVLNEHRDPPPLTDPLANPQAWLEIREQAAQLGAQLADVEHDRNGILSRIQLAALNRDNRALRAQIELTSERDRLLVVIRAAREEVRKLQQDVRELEKNRAAPNRGAEVRRLLGEYVGPYVLIECVENAAIVYPGRWRIPMEPSEPEIDRLVKQVSDAGFVAFVVRPQGWYMNSFDKLKELLTKQLQQAGRKDVSRTILPLESAESIENYLPRES